MTKQKTLFRYNELYKLTEERLENYRQLKAAQSNFKKELQDKQNLLDDYYTPTSNMGQIGRASYDQDAAYNAAARLLDIKGAMLDIERELKELDWAVGKLEQAVNQLDRKLKEIIELRYFEGLCWLQVAEKAGYTEEHCRRLRRKAVTQISIGLFGVRAEMSDDFQFTFVTYPRSS